MEVAVGIVLGTHRPGEQLKLGTTHRFLITRRRSDTVYGGWWEFPGGKIEPGETPDQAVVRELYEEVAADARVIARLPLRTHTYEHATVRLHPLVCQLAPHSPEPRPVEVDECRWTSLAELDRDTFLPANGPLLDSLRDYLASRP